MSETSESGSRPSEDGLRSQGCDLHGEAFTFGCPGCEEWEDAQDYAAVRERTRWWRLDSLCDRAGHFYKRLEPQVYRCRLCGSLLFEAATMEQLQMHLLPRERRSSRDLQDPSAASPVPEEQP